MPASTWQVDLVSHVLSNCVQRKTDVVPTFGVQMKTAQASPQHQCRHFLTNAERGLKNYGTSRDLELRSTWRIRRLYGISTLHSGL
jgi:hypothetical protein